jgi:hypothetical protein
MSKWEFEKSELFRDDEAFECWTLPVMGELLVALAEEVFKP